LQRFVIKILPIIFLQKIKLLKSIFYFNDEKCVETFSGVNGSSLTGSMQQKKKNLQRPAGTTMTRNGAALSA